MNRRVLLRVIAVLALLALAAVGVRALLRQFRPADHDIPTARVKRGDLEVKVYSAGELRPARSFNLMAPPVGGTLQIVRMARTGAHVKEGDVVIEFDPSEQEYKLEQARSQLDEATQQITKAKADAAVQDAEDKVALLKARFDVRRAELDVSRNELLSSIDAQKNNLALDEAKRRLAQLEQDIRSRSASNEANLAVLAEKRNKSQLDMQQAQAAIDKMHVRSTLDGVVAIKDNMDAMGGFFYTGMVVPEYREGDTVRPGRIVAEVLQVQDMEIQGKINESDRGNVNNGQAVEVQVDALPGVTLPGHVKSVAGLASRTWWDTTTARKFEASFKLDKVDPRLRTGQTALVIIAGDQVKNALFLPRQALFDKDGKPVLYVKTGSRFEPREIKITHRTESQITVDGLSEGDEVALVNPEKSAAPGQKNAPSGPAAGGGR